VPGIVALTKTGGSLGINGKTLHSMKMSAPDIASTEYTPIPTKDISGILPTNGENPRATKISLSFDADIIDKTSYRN
jgi:hypothetical protein